MSKNFNVFAEYYDYFYSTKDYSAEVSHVLSLIISNHSNAKNILNLGCGTGRHDFYLAENGLEVTAIDASQKMIDQAKRKQSQELVYSDNVNFECCDIREYKPTIKFDAVISMFDVMSYITDTQDLVRVFSMISTCLVEKGVFVFDFWYGPGVLLDPPETRVKQFTVKSNKVVRIAHPRIIRHENKVEIDYQLLVLEGENKGQYNELHTMRYFFLPEIELMLSLGSLKIHNVCVLGSEEPLEENSWHALVIAKRD